MYINERKGDVTRVLEAVRQQGGAAEELLPLVYNELRQLAAARLAGDFAGQTLQATALVHEAWLRLATDPTHLWKNRTHFFRAAALAMRHILIERARRKLSLKRGARAEHVSIEEVDVAETQTDDRILMIDEALGRLQEADAELAQIVLLKFYGGLTNIEVGEMLKVTERTVHNKWAFARAWLLDDIQSGMETASAGLSIRA